MVIRRRIVPMPETLFCRHPADPSGVPLPMAKLGLATKYSKDRRRTRKSTARPRASSNLDQVAKTLNIYWLSGNRS